MKKLTLIISGAIILFSACSKEKDLQNIIPQVIVNKILYTGPDANYASQLFVMNDDGSGITQLTYNTGNSPYEYSQMGSWLADGSKIVFISNRDNQTYEQIYVMDSDGSNVTQVSNNTRHNMSPIFSPAGDKILYSAGLADISTSDHQFFMINIDGNNDSQFSFFTRPTDTSNVGVPNFSPDGSKIMFMSNHASPLATQWLQFVMNHDGTNVIQLSGDPFEGSYLFSPDGSKIAFTTNTTFTGETVDQIWVMNADGSNRIQVTNIQNTAQQFEPDTYVYFQSWSPDGNKLLFSSNKDNLNSNGEFYTVNIDGSGMTQLTFDGTPKYSASWK